MERKEYPSDVSDEEWWFVMPYVTLMSEEAPQREHALREVYNGLRYVVRGHLVADDAERFTAVVYSLSTNTEVVESRCL